MERGLRGITVLVVICQYITYSVQTRQSAVGRKCHLIEQNSQITKQSHSGANSGYFSPQWTGKRSWFSCVLHRPGTETLNSNMLTQLE